MELTKQEKFMCYSNALIDIENNKFNCCCVSFQETLRDKLLHKTVWDFLSESKTMFNELFDMKTIENAERSVAYWFKNKQERVDALKKCIEMTK